MAHFVRAYLRASTEDQDATRAKSELRAFAKDRGLRVAAWYVENVSGASLQRPELFRLLSDSQPGDVLLVEQVDRLSRLTAADWERLKAEIRARQVRIVALDVPTSYAALGNGLQERGDFLGRVLDAINDMLLDMLAAVARKDYEDRRRRQVQGIAKAKTAGRYKGRPENTERNAAIVAMLRNRQPWGSIVKATGCSRSTLAKLAKRVSTPAQGCSANG
jgi:DNA invertase Pin-like site-specific DNA recombinase